MKQLAIFGCSHAAGFEIHGGMDSKENRESSFGNILANRMGRVPVNAAVGGSCSAAIARTLLSWVTTELNPADDTYILVCWTEGARLEYPHDRGFDYKTNNLYADYWLPENDMFIQINMGLDPEVDYGGDEKDLITYWQKHNAEFNYSSQIELVNLIIQAQLLLKSKGIPYTMCNTMYALDPYNKFLQLYYGFIDTSTYIDFNFPDRNFYHYYKDNGYLNKKAKYWHHGREPHELYAEKLYGFISNNG